MSAQRKQQADASYSNKVDAWKGYSAATREAGMADLPRIFSELTNVDLQVVSGGFACKCPFHDDKKPSMLVSPTGYKCQAATCGVGGDVFKLVGHLEIAHRFHDQIDFIAAMVGVEKPAIIGGTAKVIKYTPPKPRETRENEFLAYPSELEPCDLQKIPDDLRLPLPGQPFKMWREDRSNDPNPKKEGISTYRPEMVHVYRDRDAVPKLVVMRIRLPSGDKLFVPARLGDAWDNVPGGFRTRDGKMLIAQAATKGHRRPIYGLEDLNEWIANPRRGPIITVEGEKCRDRMVEHCGRRGALIISPLGGGESVKFMDWTPITDAIAEAGITDIRFLPWPDADKPKTITVGGEKKLSDPQGKFAKTVSYGFLRDLRTSFQEKGKTQLLDEERINFSRILPLDHVDSGWDVADAIDEGWSGNDVAIFMKNNQVGIDMSNMAENKLSEPDPEISGAEQEGSPAPFDPATSTEDPAASGVNGDGTVIRFTDELDQMLSETNTAAPQHVPDPEASIPDEDIPPLDDEDDEQPRESDRSRKNGRLLIRKNNHFRCLGSDVSGRMFFMNMRAALIFESSTGSMSKTFLLRLADLDFWRQVAPQRDDRGITIGVNWDMATDFMFRETEEAGYWNGRREVRQGAKLDKGRIVFHTGERLWIEGRGVESIQSQGDHHLEYFYTQSSDYPMPDMENPFPQNSPEVRKLLDIIKRLDWRSESRNRATLSLFGYLTISPICGILKWRPHIWLDGSRGAGKTWVMQNIVNPTLGKYREMVKSNSTESGLRNLMNSRAIPVIFDEAEGTSQRDKSRMDEILSLARHTSSETDSVVAQGVSGGGSSKSYEISSMFLLSSITNRITSPADRTRFARLSLASGLRGDDFTQTIEIPARDLITPQFSSRLIARMIIQAKNAEVVVDRMVRTLMSHNMERRIADVYGVFAAGCWMALRDDVPESEAEASAFIQQEFGAIRELIEINEELTTNRDHEVILSSIMSHAARIDTQNGSPVTESVAVLLRIAAGVIEDDSNVSPRDAFRVLSDMGIRPANDTTPVDAGSDTGVTTFLIHKASPVIKKILNDTPYDSNYADILRQSPRITMGKTVRFRSLSHDRPVVVPVQMFGIRDGVSANAEIGEESII